VTAPHLAAALALWRYATGTAAWVFGRSTGDLWADRILDYLREAFPGEVKQDEIRRQVLGRNAGAGEPLAHLEELGLAVRRVDDAAGRGRPARWWRAADTPPPTGRWI